MLRGKETDPLNAFRTVLAACLCVTAVAAGTIAGQRVNFEPKIAAGETMRYQIESRSSTTGKITTPMVNPEGSSRSNQVIHLLIRLDVLGVPSSFAAGSGAARLRATFEKSNAESETDPFDPSSHSLADSYAQLEGHSVEFALGPDGQITDLKDVNRVLPERSAAEPIVSWFGALSPGAGIPRKGVRIGQSWKSERPVQGQPLADLMLHTESSYLRDEACNSSAPAGAGLKSLATGGLDCAVILTRFTISRRGAAHVDATPEDYRRNGLRTSGSWTSSGEALDSIALATGLVVSSTQTITQDLDYEIVSVSNGSSIHEQGHTQNQSEIVLIAEPSAAKP
jgi:hypothetical protein